MKAVLLLIQVVSVCALKAQLEVNSTLEQKLEGPKCQNKQCVEYWCPFALENLDFTITSWVGWKSGPTAHTRNYYGVRNELYGETWRIIGDGYSDSGCVKHGDYAYLVVDVGHDTYQVDLDNHKLAHCGKNSHGKPDCYAKHHHLWVKGGGSLEWGGQINFKTVSHKWNFGEEEKDEGTMFAMGANDIKKVAFSKSEYNFAPQKELRIGNAPAPSSAPAPASSAVHTQQGTMEMECHKHGDTQADWDGWCNRHMGQSEHPCWFGISHTCESKSGDGCTCW